jgi:acyl carrier protein
MAHAHVNHAPSFIMGHVMTLTDAAFSTNARVTSTRERVAGLVLEILEKRSVSREVLADDDLRDIGVTSLDMVSLMLAVEAEFDLTIPEGEMTPQNFRSISAIDTLIATLPRNK